MFLAAEFTSQGGKLDIDKNQRTIPNTSYIFAFNDHNLYLKDLVLPSENIVHSILERYSYKYSIFLKVNVKI